MLTTLGEPPRRVLLGLTHIRDSETNELVAEMLLNHATLAEPYAA